MSFIQRKHYDFLGPENYILTLEFLLAYLLISFVLAKSSIQPKNPILPRLALPCYF